MAIDTENKRRSVMAYAGTGMMPVPDGTIDASDRATLAWLYAGLSYGSPVAQISKRILGIGFFGRLASVLIFLFFYGGTI